MPEIQRTLVLSTSHLSANSRRLLDTPDPWSIEHNEYALPEFPGMFRDSEGHGWLDGGGRDVVSIPYEYGWFVYAHDDQLDLPSGAISEYYPADLLACFRYARLHRCDWIKFDRDREPDTTGSLDDQSGLVIFNDDGSEPSAPTPQTESDLS